MDSPELLEAVDQQHEFYLTGLTNAEAERLQQKFGRNELPRHKSGWRGGFLGYFWGPIPWALMITTAICVVFRLWLQAEIVGVGFIAIALMGCAGEYVGRRRVAKLRTKFRHPVCVKRDSQWVELPTSELVPGDLIEMKSGDIVPADVHLVGGDAVGINTVHPSMPVSRIFQPGDLVYAGSPINFGKAYAVVHATGAQTILGRRVQRLVDHMTATYFYENAIKFDKSILHFDEPLGGEWSTVDGPRQEQNLATHIQNK